MSEHVAFLDGGTTDDQGVARATSPFFTEDGILEDTDLAVAQNGTPNNTVVVAAGSAIIGYDSPNAGVQDDHHFCWNTANKSVTITANSSGNDRIDSIVCYVDTTAAGASNNSGAFKFIAVAGTPAASPVAPSDSTIQTAVGGAGVPWILLAQVAVANGFSTITDANITDARPKTNTQKRIFNSTANDFVISGGVWSQTSGLVGGMTACLAMIDGEIVTKPPIAKTFTASKDTYVDMLKTVKPTINADLTYTEVTPGGAVPSLASGAVRLAIVTTDGSNITGVVSSGIYGSVEVKPTSPVPTSSVGGIQLTSNLQGGWIPFNLGAKPAYASASTITMPTDSTTVLQKGDKIRWKQGAGFKYGIIASQTATLTTIIVNNDYTVANAAITDFSYSRADNPFGFPAWFAYTPTGVASSNVTNAGRYRITGLTAEVDLFFSFTGAITFTTKPSLPITSSANIVRPTLGAGSSICGFGSYTDNGTAHVQYGVAPSVEASASVVTIYNTSGSEFSASVPITWANGDTMRVRLWYEI